MSLPRTPYQTVTADLFARHRLTRYGRVTEKMTGPAPKACDEKTSTALPSQAWLFLALKRLPLMAEESMKRSCGTTRGAPRAKAQSATETAADIVSRSRSARLAATCLRNRSRSAPRS